MTNGRLRSSSAVDTPQRRPDIWRARSRNALSENSYHLASRFAKISGGHCSTSRAVCNVDGRSEVRTTHCLRPTSGRRRSHPRRDFRLGQMGALTPELAVRIAAPAPKLTRLGSRVRLSPQETTLARLRAAPFAHQHILSRTQTWLGQRSLHLRRDTRRRCGGARVLMATVCIAPAATEAIGGMPSTIAGSSHRCIRQTCNVQLLPSWNESVRRGYDGQRTSGGGCCRVLWVLDTRMPASVLRDVTLTCQSTDLPSAPCSIEPNDAVRRSECDH